MDVEIRFLQRQDVESMAAAFNKPASQYQSYFAEQEEGGRTVLTALREGKLVGYLTIVWRSNYRPFRKEKIPEIQDFNVLSRVRRKGIGTRLMEKAEQIVAQRSAAIGIGVGLTADYGAAQRLYVLRGYIPDGRGLVWQNRSLKYGEQITVDDSLVLHLIKTLAP